MRAENGIAYGANCVVYSVTSQDDDMISTNTKNKKKKNYSPNLHTKLKPIKIHVMDGYTRKAIWPSRLAALKTDNNNINARKIYSTKQNLS